MSQNFCDKVTQRRRGKTKQKVSLDIPVYLFSFAFHNWCMLGDICFNNLLSLSSGNGRLVAELGQSSPAIGSPLTTALRYSILALLLIPLLALISQVLQMSTCLSSSHVLEVHFLASQCPIPYILDSETSQEAAFLNPLIVSNFQWIIDMLLG